MSTSNEVLAPLLWELREQESLLVQVARALSAGGSDDLEQARHLITGRWTRRLEGHFDDVDSVLNAKAIKRGLHELVDQVETGHRAVALEMERLRTVAHEHLRPRVQNAHKLLTTQLQLERDVYFPALDEAFDDPTWARAGEYLVSRRMKAGRGSTLEEAVVRSSIYDDDDDDDDD